jgi:putative transposase
MQYTIEHHLVWVPKYRASTIGGDVIRCLREVFTPIAREHNFHIDTLEVMEDYVHIFIEAPPAYSPAKIVQILKSISTREVFKKFPEMKRFVWSWKIRSEGYFVKGIGENVTADIIRKNIEYQKQEEKSSQLIMLEKSKHEH